MSVCKRNREKNAFDFLFIFIILIFMRGSTVSFVLVQFVSFSSFLLSSLCVLEV